MKKYWWVGVIIILLFPIGVYWYCEYKLNKIALKNIPDDIPPIYFYSNSPEFNKALWIYYTEDKEFRMNRITLWRTLYEFISTRGIEKNGDNIIYIAARKLLIESKRRSLNYQITWLAVSEWISRNWSMDQCLNYIANTSYYGNGCFGISNASKMYFNKNPKELNIDNICMLIAVTISPTRYDLNKRDENLIKKAKEVKDIILKSSHWN